MCKFKHKSPIKKFSKILFGLILGLLLLIFLLAAILSTPIVQTKLAHFATEKINKQFNIHTNIEKLAIGFNGSVLLKGVSVIDDHRDTLAFIKGLETNILDLNQLLEGRLFFSKTQLNNVDFHIHTYKNDTLSNLDKFIKVFDDGKEGSGKFLMSIEELVLKNGHFSITDDNKPNPETLRFKGISGKVKDFLVKGANVQGKIRDLHLTGFGGLQLEGSSTDFSMGKTFMNFKNLLFKTKESLLVGTVGMSYKEGDLKSFAKKVNIFVDVDNSTLATNDIRYFYNKIGENQKYYLKTVANGTLSNFTLVNTILTNGEGAHIIGNFKFENLIGVSEKPLKITTNLDRLMISRTQAVAVLPTILDKALPKELDKLGTIDLSGAFSYSNFEVEADLKATSALGYAEANVVMAKVNDKQNASYTGNVVLEKFDIGNLTNQEKVGKTTLELFVNGKGFDIENLHTILKGNIHSLDFNGYTYQDIELNGNLKIPYYKGVVVSKDPNALLTFDGEIDFTQQVKKYNFITDIEYLNVNALKLIEGNIGNFTGKIAINASGDHIDNFVGTVHFIDTKYTTEKEAYTFANFQITSAFETDGTRLLNINSEDIAQGYLRGKFKMKQLKSIVENAMGSLYTNYSPIKLDPGQFFAFKFDINNKIVNMLMPNLHIGKDTQIEGFVNADDVDFRLDLNTPFIQLDKNNFKNVNLHINNKDTLAITSVQIDSARLAGYDIVNFKMNNNIQNDTLHIKTVFNGGKKSLDDYKLNLYYTINEENKSVVGFDKSTISFKEFLWYINEDGRNKNRVVFNKSITDFEVQDIELTHEEQSVLVKGAMRGNDYKDLKVIFDKVDLNKIVPDIDNLQLGGLINGEVALLQQNKIFKPTSNISIDQLEINKVSLGKLLLEAEGDENFESFRINSSIQNDEVESFFLQGKIGIVKGASKLDLEAGLNKFDLKIIAPFLKSIASDVRGEATGRFSISGVPSSPQVDGRLYLTNAGMRPVFTGVDYIFDENAPLDVTEKQFIMRGLTLTDSQYKTKGKVNGVISHNYFKNWNLDVKINSDNLLALNQKYKEGIPYYGTAFIDGTATLKGPAESLRIAMNATSKPGTKIILSLDDAGGVGDNNFVYFLTEKEKRNRKEGNKSQEIVNDFGGIQLDFEFLITPDAEIEVLLDRNTGHGMKGKGAGFITMEINTLGRFNMWGDFQVYEGLYNFKYDVIIDKKLQVKRFGTIRWEGNPMNAILDLEAVYKTETNPALILESSAINRKIDTDVSVLITGNLSNPQIDFNIDFPNVSSTLKSEIEYKLADKDVRQTQAMALLATGSFINSDNANTAVYGSLLERASSLFDDLFSNEDGKLKVGFNYQQANRNPLQESSDAARVGVTLSTKVSDKVLINGKLGVPIGGTEENMIVGDVEIQLLLNEDGSLRARVFNRENNINYLGEGIGYKQGVGLTYEVDFNTFKELLQKIVRDAFRRSEEKKKQQTPSQYSNDILDDEIEWDNLNN